MTIRTTPRRVAPKSACATLAVAMALTPVAVAAQSVPELYLAAKVSRKLVQDERARQASLAVTYAATIAADGYHLPPAPDMSASPVAGGGLIPAALGAPRDDGYGVMFGYCAWDNGPDTAGLGYISGQNSYAAVTMAIVSPGLDGIFQTGCADISGGGFPKGDDTVQAVRAGQLASGSLAAKSIGDPIVDLAALNALPADIPIGQVRYVTAEKTFYAKTATGWEKTFTGPFVQSTTDAGMSFTSDAGITLKIGHDLPGAGSRLSVAAINGGTNMDLLPGLDSSTSIALRGNTASNGASIIHNADAGTLTLAKNLGSVVLSADSGTADLAQLVLNTSNTALTSPGAIGITSGTDLVLSSTNNSPIHFQSTGGGVFTGPITATAFLGNATTASTLATARLINGVAFDGSADIVIEDSTKLPLTGGTIAGNLSINGTLTASGAATFNEALTASKGVTLSKGGMEGGLATQGGLFVTDLNTKLWATRYDWTSNTIASIEATRLGVLQLRASSTALTGSNIKMTTTSLSMEGPAVMIGPAAVTRGANPAATLAAGFKIDLGASTQVFGDLRIADTASTSTRTLTLANKAGSASLAFNNAKSLTATTTGSFVIDAPTIQLNGELTSSAGATFTGALSASVVTQTSDARLKTGIQSIDRASVLNRFMATRPVTYVLNSTGRQDFGFVAQELLDTFPEMVFQNASGFYSVNYSAMVPVLSAVAQHQQERIDLLQETKLDSLVDRWIKSSDGQQRLYFASGGATVLKGQGPTSLEIRNASDAAVARFASDGDLQLLGKLAWMNGGSLVSDRPDEVAFRSMSPTRAALRLEIANSTGGLAPRVVGYLFGDATGFGLADDQGRAVLTASRQADGSALVSIAGQLHVGSATAGAIGIGSSRLTASADGYLNVESQQGLRVGSPGKDPSILLGSDGAIRGKRLVPTEIVEAYSDCSGQSASIARDAQGQVVVCQ